MTSRTSAFVARRIMLAAGFVVAAAGIASSSAIAAVGLPGLPPLPVSLPTNNNLTYGCNWIESISAVRRNTGYPDTHANYQVSAMPVYPVAGATIKVRGKYAHARYFTFSAYDGYRPGNLIDSMQDYQLRPRLNGVVVAAPNPTPGPLPNTGGYQYDYELTLKYEYPPADRSQRDPDTIYMGDNTIHYLGAVVPNPFGNKQLTLRTYLPDPGANEFGDVELPTITYTAPDGSTVDSRNNPQQAQCDRLAKSQDLLLTTFPQAKVNGPANVKFSPDTSISTLHVYPNGGTNYVRGPAARIYADMVVVRFKVPPAPPLAPATDPGAQVRYTSLCQNQYDNTAVVACLADREFVAQSDGYIVTVISTPIKRPVKAQGAFGYNWLPWGGANEALVYLRQILPNSDFAGNYDLAEAQPNLPLTTTLGVWAPEISYCDAQTFVAYADAGGEPLLAACKANYTPFKNGVNTGN